MPWPYGAGTTGPRFMGLKYPTWMPTGRWSWTISCRAGSKRGQLPGSCTPSIPQMRECSKGRPPSKGGVRTNTSPTFPSATKPRSKKGCRIQRRLERLEWLCFDDKCNRLDALSCSSTLVSFFTSVQVSCADISPSCSHLMLDNSAGDIKGRRVFSA